MKRLLITTLLATSLQPAFAADDYWAQVDRSFDRMLGTPVIADTPRQSPIAAGPESAYWDNVDQSFRVAFDSPYGSRSDSALASVSGRAPVGGADSTAYFARVTESFDRMLTPAVPAPAVVSRREREADPLQAAINEVFWTDTIYAGFAGRPLAAVPAAD